MLQQMKIFIAQIFIALALILLSLPTTGMTQETPPVGIAEQLGSTIPLESFSFTDEEGKPVALQELCDRPVVLTLVYFRCPGICTPLLQELAHNVNNCDLTPGEDYRLITISFDPSETADLAKLKQTNMLASLDKKKVAADDWRFLTGDEDNIKRITKAVGFNYIKDPNEVDYVHAATVIFLSPDGKIVRYLNGTRFNPADLKLAVIDGAEGRARSFMQNLQKICFSYDPESRTYVLQLNRIILGITILFVALFGGFLAYMGSRRQATGNIQGAAQ